MQFTKLFNSILDSTIWQEPLETKVVWITMLAMVDRNGEVHASIPGLAKRAGVTIEQCKDALTCLQSPDEFSRTKDHEGRRIKEIDGGWELLNHAKYRTLLSAEERREYNRRKQAEYRNVKKVSNNVKQCQTKSAQCTHTDAESDTDTDTDTEVNTIPPNPQGGTDGEEKPRAKTARHDWREYNRQQAEKANAVSPPLLCPQEFRESWQRYQTYRTNRAVEARISSESILWTEDAALAAMRSCERASDSHGWPTVCAQIDNAISGRWQGLNFDKIQSQKTGNYNGTSIPASRPAPPKGSFL